jgi:YidC/Oxa1 family membrane protein insertase
MPIWSSFVDFLVMVLVTLSQAYGGSLGLAIITLSLIVRLSLLPITIQLARRTQKRQAQLKALEPEIEQLRRRYRSNPERLSSELAMLYSRRGYKPLDAPGTLGGLLQLPLFVGLYSAIHQGLGTGGRFLWIGNLAQPDWILTIIIAVLTYVMSMTNPSLPQNMRYLYTVLPTLVTVIFVWQLAAGLGLYWATSSAVGLLQSIMQNRLAAHEDKL